VRAIVGEDPVEFAAERPAIGVRGLEKSFGDVPVPREVDLDAGPGGVFALLGSDRAVKTTAVMPFARSSVLWAHVLTSLVANLVPSVVVLVWLAENQPAPMSPR